VVGAVAVGGALGALARQALTLGFPTAVTGFPWTVLVINVVGSALLALLPALVLHPRVLRVNGSQLLAPLLGTGLLGGFTTLSTAGEQTRALVASGHTWPAAAYVVGTLAAALVAVAAVDRLVAEPARRLWADEEGDR